MDKQTHARNLYFQTEFPVTEISEMLGIPRRTLHHWIKENHWERQKQSAACMPVMLTENCYHIISRLQQHLLSDDRATTPITHREADTLHKLVITIGKMKTRATLSESMEMMAGFMDRVNGRSPEMAQAILPFVEDYISSRSAEGAPQATPARSTGPSQAELDREALLDLEDMKAWAAQSNMPESGPSVAANPGPSPQTPHIPDVDYAARRQSPPDYRALIADLLNQDKDKKHLFPAASGKGSAVAA